MKKLIQQYIQRIKNVRGKQVLMVVLFVLVGVFGMAHTASSQNQSVNPPSGSQTYNPVSSDGTHNTVTTPGNYFTSEFWVSLAASILLYVAQLGIKITLFLFTFIIQISAYNGYLDATAVNVGWVMVRDVTNMIFVVVLLLIAFGTILGLEQYEWKKMLVKFVLAAVLVNFSRLICGILIDISQLVMTTFINGIVATAGGNLINAFGLQKIVNLNSAAKPNELTSPGIFSAAVMAVIFSLATVYTIGIFVFILAKRLVTLWILIVLSPMAFVLTIVPSTEGAASSWWGELMDNLVTGPVILFFIWLSFVTVGTGQINSEISADATKQIGSQYVIREGIQIEADKFGNQQSAGVGDAMGWNQMASFIVAVGMLIAGAEVAGQIGGSSGSALSGVADFAKKVGTVASGYTVGRYLYGAVSSGAGAAGGAAKSAAKFLALDVLPVRHYATIGANYATRQWKNFNASAAATFKEVRGDEDEVETYRDDATGKMMTRKTGKKAVTGWERVDDMKDKNFFARRLGKRMLEQLESKKTLEKTEHEFETRLAIMDKSVKGIPKGWFQRDWDRNNDGFDRRQDAYLDALGQRSSAKTEDHKAKALVAAMNSERVQFDPEKGEWVKKGGTLGREIATHQLNAAAHNAVLQKIQAEAKLNVVLDDQKNTGPYPTQLMSLMNQQAIAQKQKETADAQFKTAVGKITNQALTTKEGDDTLAARAKAEAEAHTEHNKEAEILKMAEVAFQGTKEGKHEALTDAEIARRMKALEGTSEVLKQEAEGKAVVSQAGAVAAAQLAAIQAEGEKERVKAIEESSRARVVGGVGRAAQERLERERILSATAAERAKEKEGVAKLSATQDMEKTLAAKEATALRTARMSADQKVLEERARTSAKNANTSVLRATEAAKIVAAEETTRQQQLESEAKTEATRSLEDVIKRTNVAEQAKKAAEDEMKAIKDGFLSSQVKSAADVLNAIEARIEDAGKVVAAATKALKEAQPEAGDTPQRAAEKATIATNAAVMLASAENHMNTATNERNRFLGTNEFARAIHFGRLSKVAAQETTAETGRLTEQYAGSDQARVIAERAARAGLFASTGEDAMKRIDNEQLDKLAQGKIKKMRDAIKIGERALDELRRDDEVVRAIINKEDVPDVEQNAKTTLATLRSRVRGQYIDMKIRGSTTPPTERLAVFESKSKEYKQQDEAGRGKMLMDSVMFLTNARKSGTVPDTRMLNEAVGVLMAASDDGNVDDGLSTIGDRLTKLYHYETASEEYKKSEEYAKTAKQVKELEALREVADELGLVNLQANSRKIQEEAEQNASVQFEAIKGTVDVNEHEQIKAALVDEEINKILEKGLEARHYSYIDNNDSDASRKLQSYVFTGGDMDYVRVENKVLEIMDETGKSWDEGINEFYKRAGDSAREESKILSRNITLANAAEFRDKFDEHEDVYQNIAEKTKSRSLDIGHWQLVNYAPDDNGRFRALTKKEHLATVAGSAVKMKNQQMNPQSFGKYMNTEGRMQSLDRASLRLMKALQAKDQAAAGMGLDVRARRALLDLLKGQQGKKTDQGYAVLSGSESYIKESGAGDYVTGLVDRVAKVHAALATDGNAALQINLEYGSAPTRQHAEAGIFKATIAGLENWAKETSGEDEAARKKLAVALGVTRDKLAEKVRTSNMTEYSNLLAAILESQRDVARVRLEEKIKAVVDSASYQAGDRVQAALKQKLEEQVSELVNLSNDVVVKQLKNVAASSSSKIKEFLSRSGGGENDDSTDTVAATA